MTSPRQTRMVELHRQVKIAVDALHAVERTLARELGSDTSSDELAERIRHATQARSGQMNESQKANNIKH